ncbi:MAG TPA: hypothetical protein VGF13_02255 [Verrucomicrobiae bacterium]|jgi:hypothetical protein
MEEFRWPDALKADSKPIADEHNEGIDPEPDVSPEAEAALCTYRVFPNLPDVPWCKKCGAPLGWSAVVGPADAARASGFMWRGALRGRPKVFVLLSVWVLFLPRFVLSFIGALVFLFTLLSDVPGCFVLVYLLLTLFYGTMSFLMLFHITRNFLKIPRLKLDEV